MMTIFMPAISGQLEICGSIDWNYLLGELFMTLNFRKQYVSCVKSFLSRFLFCRLILKLFVGKIHSSANIYQDSYIYTNATCIQMCSVNILTALSATLGFSLRSKLNLKHNWDLITLSI